MTAKPDLFATLADPTRREMLRRIGGGEVPAGELGRAFPGVSQPGISRHLRVLREAGLVRVRGEDRRRLYSLSPGGLAELDAWIAQFRAFWPQQLEAGAVARGPKARAPGLAPYLGEVSLAQKPCGDGF